MSEPTEGQIAAHRAAKMDGAAAMLARAPGAPAPIDLIRVDDRRIRGLTEKTVVSLMDSIREVGVLNPITVYRRRMLKDHITVDGYSLIAGWHRLEARKRLGMAKIPVHVVEFAKENLQQHLTIAECDENLCGATLTKLERANFTHRRKQAYLVLHPETAEGVSQGLGARRQVGDEGVVPANVVRFTKETADRTGRSERAVQRDAQRGEKIAPDVVDQLKGSRLSDGGVYLDELKELPAEEQRAKVAQDLASPPPPRSLPKAPQSGARPRLARHERKIWGRFESAWRSCPTALQTKFLRWALRTLPVETQDEFIAWAAAEREGRDAAAVVDRLAL